MSNGEIVPEVMTTLLKRSNTGLMAREGSRHLSLCQLDSLMKQGLRKREVKYRIGYC